MDLDKLKAFYWVALLGNITHAAHRLNTTQSALSKSIISLEERLKVKLLIRLSRGVVLTEEGKYLFEFAKKVVLEAESVARYLCNKNNEPKGELKILSTVSIASTWLMQYIPDFLEQYPEIKLTIVTDDEAATLKDADLAVRPYIHEYPDLVHKPLTTFHMRMFASKHYLNKLGTPEILEDLDHHHLLAYGGENIFPFWDANWILTVGRTPRNPREPFLRLNSSHGLLNAAKKGLGIIGCGKDYPKFENADLIEILPGIEGPEIDIYAIYPKHSEKVARITSFVSFLEAKLHGEDS